MTSTRLAVIGSERRGARMCHRKGLTDLRWHMGAAPPEKRGSERMQWSDPGCCFLYEVFSYQIKMSGQFGKLVIISFSFMSCL